MSIYIGQTSMDSRPGGALWPPQEVQGRQQSIGPWGCTTPGARVLSASARSITWLGPGGPLQSHSYTVHGTYAYLAGRSLSRGITSTCSLQISTAGANGAQILEWRRPKAAGLPAVNESEWIHPYISRLGIQAPHKECSVVPLCTRECQAFKYMYSTESSSAQVPISPQP